MTSPVISAARRCTSSTLVRVASRRHTSTTPLQSVRSPSCPNPAPLRPSRFPLSHLPRLVRRELSSLVPVHSAVSSARLVSRLALEASFSAEGRFANYLSPI